MSDRADKLKNTAHTMLLDLEDLIAMKHDLEDLGCKKTAMKLDTVLGKLENIIYEVNKKAEC